MLNIYIYIIYVYIYIYIDDDNLIILKPLPDHQDCRDYINASYVDVCIVVIGILLWCIDE